MRGSAPGERRGGRQRGVKNRRTLALAQAQAETAEKIAAALGPAGFDGDALAFLQALYRDTTQAVETRLHAARVAVAYEKPRLSAVQLEQSPSETTIRIIGGLPQFEEMARRIANEI